MNPEDELHDRLHRELGDPASTEPAGLAGAAGASDAGWAAIEEASERRQRRDRRLVLVATATAAVVVVALALVLAAHTDHSSSTALRTGSGQTTMNPGSSTSSGASITSVPTSGGVSPLTQTQFVPTTEPATTVGPTQTTTAPTTTSSTTPAGQIDCGTAYLASGWPTTILPSPTLQQCILSAFSAGTSAIYRERAQTDGEGGHIQITTYEVIGVRQVRRTIDATGAQPPGGVTTSTCSGLASGPDGQVVASGCVAA
jgi:hypothetical protein